MVAAAAAGRQGEAGVAAVVRIVVAAEVAASSYSHDLAGQPMADIHVEEEVVVAASCCCWLRRPPVEAPAGGIAW